jgi:hypothetical protein
MKEEGKGTIETKVSREAEKKRYRAPKLAVYGDAHEITSKLDREGSKSAQVSGPSDRNLKENFAPADCRKVLERLAELPVETWNYKGEGPEVRHMGPMAQDFASAFGLGDDDKRIHAADASGVALASIQALYGMVREREAELGLLREQVEELRRELAELKHHPAPL